MKTTIRERTGMQTRMQSNITTHTHKQHIKRTNKHNLEHNNTQTDKPAHQPSYKQNNKPTNQQTTNTIKHTNHQPTIFKHKTNTYTYNQSDKQECIQSRNYAHTHIQTNGSPQPKIHSIKPSKKHTS